MASATATLVVEIVSDVKKATSGLDEVASRTDKMKAGLATAAKVATGVLLGLGAAAVKAGQAAAEDAQGQALLAKSLTNSTGATKAQIASVEDWIGSMSLATGVADDQLRPALATLARATGDTAKSQDALKVALDVAAATGRDVESVSDAIAKGYAGQTTALGRLVPGLSKATLASGDMNAVMEELKAKTGGSAAAAADTAAGKMQRMTVAFNEAKESIGAGMLPVMSKFATIMYTVGNAVAANPKVVTALAIAIGVLATAVIAVNAVVSVWSTVVRIATAVQWLWNVAMSANPIGLVVIAVIALVVAIVILWKKSDAFRSFVIGMWTAIKTVALAVASALRVAWDATMSAIKSSAQAVANVVTNSWDRIKSGVQAVLSWIKGNWPTILAILTGPIGIAVGLIVKNWDTIRNTARNVFDAIESAWRTTITALKNVVGGLGDALSAPFRTVKSAIDTLIDAVQSLINWLGKIHVPKIHIPHIPGTRAAAPSVAPVGLARFAAPAVAAPMPRASATSGGGPTIIVNGAIDPEATARQIQRILTGHSRRVGLSR